MKRITILTAIFSILITLQISAQEVDSLEVSKKDTSGSFEWSVKMMWDTPIQPRIDLVYGMTEPKYHENAYKGNLSATNLMEIKLGYEKTRKYRDSETIFKYSFNNFFVSNIKEINSVRDDADFEKVRTEAWRFGFNDANGFGYELGSGMKLALGSSSGIGWTKLDFLDTAMTSADQRSLDYFGDVLRFGTQSEANITLKFTENIGLSGSYERVAVFPRLMFWYWTASELVKGATTGLLSAFISEVGKASPSAVPVVNFVLKNALNYGFYELRQKHMNWPVYTEAPLIFDTFKIGVNVNF